MAPKIRDCFALSTALGKSLTPMALEIRATVPIPVALAIMMRRKYI